MTTVVVPFAGTAGKTRLDAPRSARRDLSLAMLADVLGAAIAIGSAVVVTSDAEGAALARELGAGVVSDPGGGQGPAVQAALAGVEGPAVVVNADVPCVVPEDIRSLAAAVPEHGIALVEALDGTTNALGLSSADLFRPLYGPDSARRFHALDVETVSVVVPNLAEDVDTMADLERLQLRCGPRTQAVLSALTTGIVAMNVVVLSGGVGGARFVQGVVAAVDDVVVVGNVGDDLEVLGLHVSPDLDSIMYALAGLNDEARGWGRADESWRVLDSVAALGGETWFRLGDLDLGVHLVRTQALAAGEPLSQVTARLCAELGVATRLLPATDDRLRTWIATAGGELTFQDWFVAHGHREEVDGLRFEDADVASAAPGVLDAIAAADLLLLAPSNPYVSIAPILAVREIRDALAARRVPCVAVSPLIGGRAVKGPADRMLARLAGGTSPRHVAECYEGLIDAIVVDEADAADLDGLGDVRPIVARTLMVDADARRRLAEAALGAVPA